VTRPSETAGPLLLLCLHDDPYAEPFKRSAAGRGIDVWQPASLDEITWSVDPVGDADALICDRIRGRTWSSAQLAGVWFQAFPLLKSAEFFDSRSRSYISAEVWASWACLCERLRCPAVGSPSVDQPVVGLGLPARVEMRRLGIDVLKDGLAPSSKVLAGLPTADRTWVVRSVEQSGWASELSVEAVCNPPTTWGTTLLDDRRILAVIRIDRDAKMLEVNGDNIQEIESVPALTKIGSDLGRITASRLGVTLFGRQGDHWVLARHLLQMPYWLCEPLGPWLHSQLIEVFAADA
jgi:hypothetical protein